MIRVLLADDQTLMRLGLRELLELTDDIRVVAEAQDGLEALALIDQICPDVLLLDIRMPHLGGLGVLKEVRTRSAPPPTLLLTTFEDDAALFQGLCLGARGYLMKDVTFERLTEAIRTVAGGGSFILPAMTARVERGLAAIDKPFDRLEPPCPLTPREMDVLRLIATGWSNKEIARALQASDGTIRNHVSSILSKLGVRDRIRAVLRAVEVGYLQA